MFILFYVVLIWFYMVCILFDVVCVLSFLYLRDFVAFLSTRFLILRYWHCYPPPRTISPRPRQKFWRDRLPAQWSLVPKTADSGPTTELAADRCPRLSRKPKGHTFFPQHIVVGLFKSHPWAPSWFLQDFTSPDPPVPPRPGLLLLLFFWTPHTKS